jgi:hypothetical protein
VPNYKEMEFKQDDVKKKEMFYFSKTKYWIRLDSTVATTVPD